MIIVQKNISLKDTSSIEQKMSPTFFKDVTEWTNAESSSTDSN